MKFTAFLPPHFKDLIRFVPTILFEVTEWSSLLSESTSLSMRMLSGQGRDNVVNHLKNHFGDQYEFGNSSLVLKDLNLEQKKDFAEKILSFYFALVLSPKEKFLDLSLETFYLSKDKLGFNPTNLWSEFSPSFQSGIRAIYHGFYEENQAEFMNGLIQTKLIDTSWSDSDKKIMHDLFYSHFGNAKNEEMFFNISKFQESFHEVFKFLLQKKVKINPDFLKLGIMLVTLYTSLETLEVKISPHKCFMMAQN